MSATVSLQDITLRPAIAADVDWGAPLMFASGPALFSYVFASEPQEAEETLRQAFGFAGHAFSFDHAQVLEVTDKPAGLIIAYQGNVKRKAEEKVQGVMAKILPLKKLPGILMNVADLTRIKQNVAMNDYYILSLSIAPEWQSQGLGTAVLKDAEIEAQELGCRSICLDVPYSNDRARALFERLGYRVIASRTSDRFQQATQAGGLHRMEKRFA
jgi:ribosomal protein S18 acetylase RimI-like enzyme